jgi:hypothetical protein
MRAVTLLRGCTSSSTFEPQFVSWMLNYRSEHTRVVQFFEGTHSSLRQGVRILRPSVAAMPDVATQQQ